MPITTSNQKPNPDIRSGFGHWKFLGNCFHIKIKASKIWCPRNSPGNSLGKVFKSEFQRQLRLIPVIALATVLTTEEDPVLMNDFQTIPLHFLHPLDLSGKQSHFDTWIPFLFPGCSRGIEFSAPQVASHMKETPSAYDTASHSHVSLICYFFSFKKYSVYRMCFKTNYKESNNPPQRSTKVLHPTTKQRLSWLLSFVSTQ